VYGTASAAAGYSQAPRACARTDAVPPARSPRARYRRRGPRSSGPRGRTSYRAEPARRSRRRRRDGTRWSPCSPSGAGHPRLAQRHFLRVTAVVARGDPPGPSDASRRAPPLPETGRPPYPMQTAGTRPTLREDTGNQREKERRPAYIAGTTRKDAAADIPPVPGFRIHYQTNELYRPNARRMCTAGITDVRLPPEMVISWRPPLAAMACGGFRYGRDR